MSFTIHRSSGNDIVIGSNSIDTANNNATTTIYDEAGASIISVNVKDDQYIKATPSSVWSGQGNGTAIDTLIGSANGDLVVWDSHTTSGLSFNSGFTTERLYDSGDGANRDFEIFDLRGGNDILNLTHENSGFFATAAYSGAATVFGGAGNDLIATGAAADRIWGDAGTGIASVTPGSDTIYAGDGNDIVFGDNGSTDPNETIGAADTIFGGLGDDTMYGEGGDDFISQAFGTDTAYGGAGNDTLDAAGGLNNLSYGGDGNDRLIAADIGYGGNGDDWIDGGYGGTVLGADTLYGDAGNDTIYGYDANDTLYGGTGADSLYGGTENDLLWSSSDATLSAGGSHGVKVWDGASGAATTIAASGQSYSFDLFDGGDGTDTLALTGDNDIFVASLGDINSGSGYGAYGAVRLTGIELILAGAGADIIALNHFDSDGAGLDHSVIFADNITVAGEDGNDTVYSGAGNDLIVGGHLTTGFATDGADVLFGGAGNDTIWGDHLGDLVYGGNDVLYGGLGADTIFGGGGNDTISDADGTSGVVTTSIQGGDGADFITVAFTNTQHIGLIDGGANSGADGADRILITGSYDHVTSNLGLGNDVYIGGGFEAAPGSGGIDIVSGGLGSDVIAGWSGNDILYGDNSTNSDGAADGGDALWGGAGVDTIYGGAGSDVIYPGTGGNNIMYGGANVDYYYVTRADGANNQIWDESRIANSGTHENYLVIQPDFNTTTDVVESHQAGVDFLTNGQGVFEADHNIMNASGMVQIVNQGGDLWTLNMISGVGSGSTSIIFDDRDINQIVLWNNDADPTLGQHTLQIYQYSSVTHSYDFLS